jgi:predicted component of type VI protein secretion system
MTAPTEPPAEVVLTLQLLDATQGLPIQTWHFPVQPEVRVGRANENDVVIPHPYVSRQHARLVWRDGDWELVNVGTHGTLRDGRAVTRALLEDGDELRLGPQGPTIRVRARGNDSSPAAYVGTMVGDANDLPSIRIDAAKKTEEVQAVADTEYFRELQARLQTLRDRKR